MRRTKIAMAIVMMACSLSAMAQQVNTLYFLENAPMRHLMNPAFQPVSNGYYAGPLLGFTSMQVGNNSLTFADAIYTKDGQLITALHPDEDRELLMKKLRRNTSVQEDMTKNLLSFGFRHRENGYVTIGINERIEMGVAMPKTFSSFLLNGGMKDPTGVNNISLKGFNTQMELYTEIYGGYSYKINEQWTVGGKVKVLLGTVAVGTHSKNMQIDASMYDWHIYGKSDIYVAAPLDLRKLPQNPTIDNFRNFDYNSLIPSLENPKDFLKLAAPAGGGVGVDLGMTYKPHERVQITAALTDLGFIYWSKAQKYTSKMDTVCVGVGDFNGDDYIVNGRFDTDSLMRDVLSSMEGLILGGQTQGRGGFARMTSARLNIGVDANFWDNRVGVGIVSSTRLYNYHLYEEVTLGAAFRPVNWFNLAVSYSLVNNGKMSNIGAGISLMPYDGINLTLAADYIPTNYADVTTGSGKQIKMIPYKTKGVNLAFGLSIVWGTNKNKKRDSDKDGVYDRLDMCPGTPKGVAVDTLGCPIDSDGDGVPDYLDDCNDTPAAAYGWIDEHGCPTDEDMDSVPDYKDLCPGTLPEARAYVNENGCDKDTDGDGVPDWRDLCPDTPEGAAGYVDSVGCELDTDGDGVPDWRDLCPNTPMEAYDMIDANGCELDTDGDGVPDWRDRCPHTEEAAREYVDEFGCDKDTDGDGVPDYLDECPTVPGVKENKGCPALKREYTNVLKKAMSGIQFETGKAIIKKSSNTILNQVASIFLEDTSFRIEVQGHTDNVGKPEANKTLSQKRAEAVRDYMIKKGVAADRLTAVGYGDERPIADNATSKGRATNRRVEFDLIYEEKVTEVIMDHADPVVEPAPADSTANSIQL